MRKTKKVQFVKVFYETSFKRTKTVWILSPKKQYILQRKQRRLRVSERRTMLASVMPSESRLDRKVNQRKQRNQRFKDSKNQRFQEIWFLYRGVFGISLRCACACIEVSWERYRAARGALSKFPCSYTEVLMRLYRSFRVLLSKCWENYIKDIRGYAVILCQQF